jgi:D-alanyl-D-alanine carboxypeptidase
MEAMMAPNYRSLVPNGFFSFTPFDRTVPVSIRCNNPGAINGASWEKRYPGYVDTVETTPGNKTTIFEAPEYGVAVWWELLRRYAAVKVTTVGGIISRYGGGQDYSNYIRFVERKTGLAEEHRIPLDDDETLLAFGKAMFQYEAGRPTPLSDKQIVFGLRLGRADGDVTGIDSERPVVAVSPAAAMAPEVEAEASRF